MAYVAPNGDNVLIDYLEAPGYIAPNGDNVLINYIHSNFIHLNAISFSGNVITSAIIPGWVAVPVSALALTENAINSDIAPGNGVAGAYNIPGMLSPQNTLIGRGTHIHNIPASLVACSISVVPGIVYISLDVIPFSAIPKNTFSIIFVTLSALQSTISGVPLIIFPGSVSILADVLQSSLLLPLIDRIYLPIKGLGMMHMQLYHSQVSDNSDYNGGILSQRKVKNVHNNVLPYISDIDRINGSTVYRKVFWRNVHEENSNLLNGIIYIDKYYASDHLITILPCGYSDVQRNILPTAREYGTGILTSNVNSGSTQFSVLISDVSLDIFKTGDTIVLTSGSNNETFINITVISKILDVVAISVPIPTKYAYSTGALVSSCINLNTLSNFCPRVVVNSTSGSHNSQFPIEVYGNGCIRQTWTLDFISDTTYTCTGVSIGMLNTYGYLTTDYSPINPYTGTPYFTIDKRALVGQYQEGDLVIFTTNIAVTCMWVKRVTPPNSTTTLNAFSCTIQGYT